MMITNGYLAHKWKHGKLMLLTSATNHLAHSYDFTYDGLNRMTDAVYDDASGGRNRYNETVSYNANGSALTIKRNGRNDAGNYTAIDNLTLGYRGNRLLKVTDKGDACTATGATDFNDGANITVEYTYDGCGARTSDANKGIAGIQYSYWGTPELIQFTNGSQTRYVYDASGVKQKRIHITAVDNIVVPLKTVMELSDDQILTSDTTEYLGNLVFENGRLDKVLFSSGYVSCSDDNNQERFTFHYFVKDHLGNNRAVVNESGAIEQTTHYYPFGNSIADIGTNASLQQYKYNGKELDRMHGLDWYDYGARNYDPVILQWDRPDPLADKYHPVSPYVYCVDNPVSNIDPDGRKVVIWYTNRKGERKPFVFTGFHGQKSISVPKDPFILDFIKSYLYNAKNGGGENMIKAVTSSKLNIELRDATLKMNEDFNTEYYKDGKAYIFWESRKGLKTTDGGKQSPATRLEHEFDHAVDDLTNPHNHSIRQKQGDSRYGNKEEKRVITGSERKTAKANKEDVRYNHYGETFDVSDPTKVR